MAVRLLARGVKTQRMFAFGNCAVMETCVKNCLGEFEARNTLGLRATQPQPVVGLPMHDRGTAVQTMDFW